MDASSPIMYFPSFFEDNTIGIRNYFSQYDMMICHLSTNMSAYLSMQANILLQMNSRNASSAVLIMQSGRYSNLNISNENAGSICIQQLLAFWVSLDDCWPSSCSFRRAGIYCL